MIRSHHGKDTGTRPQRCVLYPSAMQFKARSARAFILTILTAAHTCILLYNIGHSLDGKRELSRVHFYVIEVIDNVLILASIPISMHLGMPAVINKL